MSGAWENSSTPILAAEHVAQNSPSKPSALPRSSAGKKPIVTAAARSERVERGYDPLMHVGNPENLVTPRQLEVLALVASGYSYADVARMKFYSPHTVQSYVAAAVSRVGARSTTHLCVLLVEVGLIRRNSDGIYEPVQDMRLVD
jgi:DNA-binding CsgD family transcriptional regulator